MKELRETFNGLEFVLGDGELHHFLDEDGSKTHYYLCPLTIGTNKVLVQYVLDSPDEVCNFVVGALEQMPKVGVDYFVKVLKEETNVLVRLVRYGKATGTGFAIYEDYDGGDSPDEMIQWIMKHCDFQNDKYMFTRCKDGHQEAIKD